MDILVKSRKHGMKRIICDDDISSLIANRTWCVSGYKGRLYAITRFYNSGVGKNILMHRLIMNAKEDEYVDHINHNTLDNRKENLRICTNQQNCMNSTVINKNKSSKYKGVCYCKQTGKYTSQIMINRKYIWLGRHITERDAAKAYNAKAIEIFKDFACLNIIE